jgi:hypothetical protein
MSQLADPIRMCPEMSEMDFWQFSLRRARGRWGGPVVTGVIWGRWGELVNLKAGLGELCHRFPCFPRVEEG